METLVQQIQNLIDEEIMNRVDENKKLTNQQINMVYENVLDLTSALYLSHLIKNIDKKSTTQPKITIQAMVEHVLAPILTTYLSEIEDLWPEPIKLSLSINGKSANLKLSNQHNSVGDNNEH